MICVAWHRRGRRIVSQVCTCTCSVFCPGYLELVVGFLLALLIIIINNNNYYYYYTDSSMASITRQYSKRIGSLA